MEKLYSVDKLPLFQDVYTTFIPDVSYTNKYVFSCTYLLNLDLLKYFEGNKFVILRRITFAHKKYYTYKHTTTHHTQY